MPLTPEAKQDFDILRSKLNETGKLSADEQTRWREHTMNAQKSVSDIVSSTVVQPIVNTVKDIGNSPYLNPVRPVPTTSQQFSPNVSTPNVMDSVGVTPVSTPTSTPSVTPASVVPPTTDSGTTLSNIVPVTETQIQTSSTPGFRPSKEILDSLAAVNKARNEALDTYSITESAKAKEAADIAIEKQQQLEKFNADEALKQGVHSEELTKAQTEIQEATKKTDDWKLNPSRVLGDSAWTKIGAAIAIAAGAFASGLSGQKNTALDIINTAIDRDIDAQKAEFAAAKGKVEDLRSNYAIARQRIGDEKTAMAAARLNALNAVDAKLAASQAKYGQSDVANKIQEQRTNLQAQIVDQQMKLEEMAKNKSTTTVQSVTKNVDLGKLSKEQTDTGITLRKEYKAAVKDYETLAADSRQMNDLISSAKKGNPEAVNQLGYLVARQFSGPGVLTDNDLKNASVSRGEYNNISAKLNKGLFGDLTDKELEAYKRLSKGMETKANREIAIKTKEYRSAAGDYGIPDRLVVGSQPVQAETKSTAEIMKGVGAKPKK